MTVDPNNKWLQLREKDGYIYMHSPWCNSQAVVVLPFRRVDAGHGIKEEFLVVRENRPCHGDRPALYSITGGCDKIGEPQNVTAQRELLEETGYGIDLDRLIPLGTLRDSKASDMVLFAFAVEIPVSMVPEVAVGDGTKGEEGIEAVWVSEHEAVWSPDPMIAHMIARLRSVS